MNNMYLVVVAVIIYISDKESTNLWSSVNRSRIVSSLICKTEVYLLQQLVILLTANVLIFSNFTSY